MVITKNRKAVQDKIDVNKFYTLKEASHLIRDISTTKFDASVDLHVRLGVDPTKADQLVRGSVNLPYGTGKTKRVLVLCTPDKENEAKEAGADLYGLDEFIQKIESGWVDIDVIIATPSVMPKIGKLGKVLGPRNLMPNPRIGTVTNAISTAVNDVKGGKIAFKVDKAGIIHCSIGRVSFAEDKVLANAKEVLSTILRLKPASAKGTYIKSIVMVSTMSLGIKVDVATV